MAECVASANAIAIVAMWLAAGGITGVHDGADALTSAGRLTGLLGGYAALLVVLLLARIPALDRTIGLDGLARAHRRLAQACLWLLIAHTVLLTAGYTVGDEIGLGAEIRRLIESYPGVITATAGLVLLIAVVVSSARRARRRMRYQTWHFVHLYAYLAIALAWSHQIATGHEFVGAPVARAYWIALYVVALVAVVWFRFLAPLVRSLRHRLRVEAITPEGDGVVSLTIGGAGLDRLRARAGQSFGWRFLTRDRWWEAHPFSLSAKPNGERLRITVKDRGDFTRSLQSIRPGTRVVAEGPYRGLVPRPDAKVALIAGGIGITPIRALLEELQGDVALIYRVRSEDELVLRDELERLVDHIHYVVGDRDILPLVPDLAERDVYLCGPPAMIEALEPQLRAARNLYVERFAI